MNVFVFFSTLSGLMPKPMAKKLLVPIYLPYWMHRRVLKVKRAFIPPILPPHESSHWPDITRFVNYYPCMTRIATSCYMMTLSLEYPAVAKSGLIEFIRSEMVKSNLQPRTIIVRRSPFSRTRSIIRRRI